MKHTKKSNGSMILVIGRYINCIILVSIISSCSVSKQISKQADSLLLSDSAIRTGHIGISIYEPATNKYWYNYNASKYFIPASNTKLYTLYAGMKYLGDSLVGMRYTFYDALSSKDGNIKILALKPSGDPTFLNPEFTYQPVSYFLHAANFDKFTVAQDSWKTSSLGSGWAWDDYNETYMAERSPMPVYGNIIRIELEKVEENSTRYLSLKKGNTKRDSSFTPVQKYYLKTMPSFFEKYVNSKGDFNYFIGMEKEGKIKIVRHQFSNIFDFEKSSATLKSVAIPFYTKIDSTNINFTRYEHSIASKLLSERLNKQEINNGTQGLNLDFKIIHSQPSDSLFKPMMHRSDNFFAEQTLLMASNEKLGYMSDEKIIDTLLKLDLKEVPQKPKWIDGSGLSRYNLFTPQSFVYILNKMKNEFGWDRLKNILPTGGTGTLSAYYKNDSSFIYAKTGTLSNNCALSGFLITQKGRVLIFSILTNNYITGATPVRKAVEKFLLAIREKY